MSFLSGKIDLDDSEMKSAVARGAALALYYGRNVGAQMCVTFPQDFKKMLPYSVGYMDLAGHSVVQLFAEGTPYDELKSKKIDLPKSVSGVPGQPANSLNLSMQWPGDGPWLRMGYFGFPNKVTGMVYVDYDTQCNQFRANSQGESVYLVPIVNELLYLSPVQRGYL